MKNSNYTKIFSVTFSTIFFTTIFTVLLTACERTTYDYGMVAQPEKDKVKYDLKLDPQKPVRDYEGVSSK